MGSLPCLPAVGPGRALLATAPGASTWWSISDPGQRRTVVCTHLANPHRTKPAPTHSHPRARDHRARGHGQPVCPRAVRVVVRPRPSPSGCSDSPPPFNHDERAANRICLYRSDRPGKSGTTTGRLLRVGLMLGPTIRLPDGAQIVSKPGSPDQHHDRHTPEGKQPLVYHS